MRGRVKWRAKEKREREWGSEINIGEISVGSNKLKRRRDNWWEGKKEGEKYGVNRRGEENY